MARFEALVSLRSVLLLFVVSRALSATFTLTNNCAYTVWPGVLSNADAAALETTGFSLDRGESKTLRAPRNWSGRIWGRTLCSSDPSTGRFTCSTGDCGSRKVECSGGGAALPATLAEFTLGGSGGMDLYDVSLVDGYNLPMLLVPQGGTGGGAHCSATGCLVDLNGACPSDLKVAVAIADGGGSVGVAYKSACHAFGSLHYCCSEAYGNPDTCKPSSYSQFFKNACPRAYSYAFDNATSTFTCANADYTITFCPTVTSQKSSGQTPEAAGRPSINDTTVSVGGGEVNHASLSLPRWAYLALGVLGVLVLLLLLLYFSRRPLLECVNISATTTSLLSSLLSAPTVPH